MFVKTFRLVILLSMFCACLALIGIKQILASDAPSCYSTDKTLSAMLKLPTSWFDREETKEQRTARMAPIAETLACKAKTRYDLAFAITQGWFESRYDSAVMSGQCRKNTCDPDENGRPKARGPWQAHATDKPHWQLLWAKADVDPVAAAELQLMMQRARWCGGNIEHAFAAHGGGGCRSTDSAKGRFKVYIEVLETLE